VPGNHIFLSQIALPLVNALELSLKTPFEMLFKKSKPASAVEPPPALIKSEETTTTNPSEDVSVSDMAQEKETTASAPLTDSRSISSSESRTKKETTVSDSANALDLPAGKEEEIVYPTGAKLGFITLALCLSVLLMALDNTIIGTFEPKPYNQ
jgi:hypothetical protein